MSQVPPATHSHPPRERIRWGRALPVLVCVGIVGASVFGAIVMVKSRKKAPRKTTSRGATGVRIIEAVRRPIQPEVVGLARARPHRTVVISAQVAGIASQVHPNLRNGHVLEAGDLAVQIDDSDHAAEVRRFRAQLAGAHADIDRLQAQIPFIDLRVKTGEELLVVERREVERVRDLVKKGVRNHRDYDLAKLAALRIATSLTDLKMTRRLLDSQIAQAKAREEEAAAMVDRAELTLARTRIRIPFRGKVAAVQVEADQLLSPAQALFELWQVDVVEVPVVLSLADATLLAPDLDPKHLSEEARQALVSHEQGGVTTTWSGTLLRFEPVQAETQTVKAVIQVDNRQAKTALQPNFFCKVTIRAPAVEGLAVPREAVQERDRLYVVRDDKLAILKVRLGRRLGSWVLVEDGLQVNDQVIVSPLERAVAGTPLKVIGVESPGSTSK